MNRISVNSNKQMQIGRKKFKKDYSKLTDEKIKDAWKSIKCEPPCTVEIFLSQTSSYIMNNQLLEMMDIGKEFQYINILQYQIIYLSDKVFSKKNPNSKFCN